MPLTDRRLIQELLARYRHFEECILLEMSFAAHFTEVVVIFDYGWRDDGEWRSDGDDVTHVELRLGLIQEFRVHNALTKRQISHRNHWNWSLSEVALVRLMEEPADVSVLKELDMPLHRLVLFWEASNRRVEIVFSEFSLREIKLSK